MLYVVSLPLALRYLLRARRADADWLAVLGFPFVYSVVMVWGFYNFCLSLSLLLLSLGYWQRHTGSWRPAVVLKLAALLTLLYLAHPMSYLVAGLVLGLLIAADRTRWAALKRELGVLLLAYLPTLPLLGWYFWHKGAATNQPAQHYTEHLWNWLRLEPLHYFGSAEGTYRWLLSGLLTLAIAATLRQVVQRKSSGWPLLPWALGTLLLLGAYVVLPDAVAGGSITRPRWGLLSYLVLLGGLATVPWPQRFRWAGLVAGTGLAVALLGFRWQKFRAFQVGLAEYALLTPYLRPGTTLLPIACSPPTHLPNAVATDTYIPVLAQVVNYLATEQQLLSYENYEAATGYFPLV